MRKAENGPIGSALPACPLDSTTRSRPVRSDDHATPAPRSISPTVARAVSSSGAIASKTRSSRVAPPGVSQYATRRPVPETAPVNPEPRSARNDSPGVSRLSAAGPAPSGATRKPRDAERSLAVDGVDAEAELGVGGDCAGSPGKTIEPRASPARRTVMTKIPSQKKTGRGFCSPTHHRLSACPVPGVPCRSRAV
jgi:hypothetical protein